MLLVLEHRFYGKSQPFTGWETELFQHLTIENALADMAYFLTSINEDLVERYGGEQRKVVTIGGSYPGALSAWFKYKYPHIATAALASSAVVYAKEDFFEYDQQVYDSMAKSGEECTAPIEAINKENDILFSSDKEAFQKKKDMYGAGDIGDEDFLLFLGEACAGNVQKGNRTEFCDFIKTNVAGKDLAEGEKALFGWLKSDRNMVPSEDWRSEMKNTTYDPNKLSRQWGY